jgi:5-(aminomethyl)-3-furanmethanol phosphate kinase
MAVVLKIGGSLAESPTVLNALCDYLAQNSSKYHFVVIPGGGLFADAVRLMDSKFRLPPALSHKMAILGMNQYGLLLSHLISHCEVTESIETAKKTSENEKVSVLLPYKLMVKDDPFSPSWDITSDSIAAYCSLKLGENNVFLFTNVDGIYNKDPKSNSDAKLLQEISANQLMKFENRTSVDKYLPIFLSHKHIEGYVINGNCPERLSEILSDAPNVICTHIIP